MFCYLISQFFKPKSLNEWSKVVIYSLLCYYFWFFIYCDFFSEYGGTKVLKYLVKFGFMIDVLWFYYLWNNPVDSPKQFGSSKQFGSFKQFGSSKQQDNNSESEVENKQKKMKGLESVISQISKCMMLSNQKSRESINLNELDDDIITDPNLLEEHENKSEKIQQMEVVTPEPQKAIRVNISKPGTKADDNSSDNEELVKILVEE